MKKLFIFIIICVILSAQSCLCADVFTAPIDSRPVSVSYLGMLANLSGDTFTCVSETGLDYFSGDGESDHNGSSRQVRDEVYSLAAANNSSESTFIINMSSYLTGGLVGSRSYVNYQDSAEAINSLKRLMEDFPNPSYYINISMPRTLPDSRFAEVWPYNKTYEGLGSYYLKANPDSPYTSEIAKSYAHVSPAQLIMEWAYVKSHKSAGALYSWEEKFLKDFEVNYETKDPYRRYLTNYKKTYSSMAYIGCALMDMQKSGYNFELIISQDDFQLPSFITFLNDDNLLNDTVKYSFAFNYMNNPLYLKAQELYGEKALLQMEQGRGKSINFIFGTDEIPQLIYARDLSKRTGIIPHIIVENPSTEQNVNEFDVKTNGELTSSAISFVSSGKIRASEETDLFIYDYNYMKNPALFANQMYNAYKSGNNVGLVELYTVNETANGLNNLFDTLVKMSEENRSFGLHCLAAYSSWNTSANAIGLGVSRAAVYSINKQINNTMAFKKAQLSLLMGHCLEDGIYNCKIKRQLYGYYPYYDEASSEKLSSLFEENSISNVFLNKEYTANDGSFTVENAKITQCEFPWQRTFECFVKAEVN